jgi:hypothetical protein
LRINSESRDIPDPRAFLRLGKPDYTILTRTVRPNKNVHR